MQNANLNSTREECARLNAKLEVLEQRQGAAKHQISDNAQTQSVHAKQVDKCLEEHQHRLMMTINKAESRGREAAEQIAQQAVSDAQTSMQVLHCAAASCLHHALQEPIPHRLELTLQRLPQAAYDSHMSCRAHKQCLFTDFAVYVLFHVNVISAAPDCTFSVGQQIRRQL